MKKILYTIFISVSSLVIGCSDSNPVESSDKILEEHIIGTWDMDGYSVTFKSDFTFADSILNTEFFDSSHTQRDTLKRIGRYHIKNGILYMTDFHFTYVGTALAGLTYNSVEYDISIVNDKLDMKPVFVFTPESASDRALYGEWNREVWYCNYTNMDSLFTTNGIMEEKYIFYSDSSNCTHRYKYISGSFSPGEGTYKEAYTYQNMILSIPPVFNNMSVRFTDGKMFWYLNIPKKELKRQ